MWTQHGGRPRPKVREFSLGDRQQVSKQSHSSASQIEGGPLLFSLGETPVSGSISHWRDGSDGKVLQVLARRLPPKVGWIWKNLHPSTVLPAYTWTCLLKVKSQEFDTFFFSFPLTAIPLGNEWLTSSWLGWSQRFSVQANSLNCGHWGEEGAHRYDLPLFPLWSSFLPSLFATLQMIGAWEASQLPAQGLCTCCPLCLEPLLSMWPPPWPPSPLCSNVTFSVIIQFLLPSNLKVTSLLPILSSNPYCPFPLYFSP